VILRVDVLQVELYRSLGDAQLRGNCLVGLALKKVFQNLSFTAAYLIAVPFFTTAF
jgi:hypothetical protein